MRHPDYHSIPPADLVAEANQALDDTGSAIAHGATVAPDLVMRLIIAARETIAMHEPGDVRPGGYRRCVWCSSTWPCPDVRALFKVLAVGWDYE